MRGGREGRRTSSALRERKGRAIVFTNAVSLRSAASRGLGALNMPVLVLQGGMQQRARLKAYDRFASSEHATLLATDVAARGLDFSGVDYVVHYQLPRSSETIRAPVGADGARGGGGAVGGAARAVRREGLPADCSTRWARTTCPTCASTASRCRRSRRRCPLAAQLDRQQHRERRDKANDNFATSLASEMGLPSESEDDADEETELNARRAERQQTNDTARLKAQLADAMRRLERAAAKDAGSRRRFQTAGQAEAAGV